MKEGCQGAIRFSGYRVIDMDYHCLREYTMPEDGVLQYSFAFQKEIEYPSVGKMNVLLTAKVFCGQDEQSATQCLLLSILGEFQSSNDIGPQWEPNALAILFPYARSIISSFTAQSGIPAIILPTVNIAKIFQDSSRNSTPRE